MSGIAYMVIEDDDLARSIGAPNFTLLFEAGRRTIRWRGKRFNVHAMRCVGLA